MYGYCGADPVNFYDPNGEAGIAGLGAELSLETFGTKLFMAENTRFVFEAAFVGADVMTSKALAGAIQTEMKSALVFGRVGVTVAYTLASFAGPEGRVVEGAAALKGAATKVEAAAASRAATEAGAAAENATKLLNPPVNLTKKGMTHVLQRHTVNDIARFAGKSKFYPGEDISGLIARATQQPVVRQAGGNFQRVLDVGRSIGTDLKGQPTSILTVITNDAGDLVTMFPGLPR